MPVGHTGFVYRLGLLLDAGCDDRDAMSYWNEGVLTWDISCLRHNEFPVRTLMPPPKAIPTDEIGLYEYVYPTEHGADVTVQGQPIMLQCNESFQFRIEGPAPKTRDLTIMLVLYMTMLRPSY